MSLFCLCIVNDVIKKNDIIFYSRCLKSLAGHHKRGIKFFVDWSEPIISHIPKDSFVINIVDSPKSDNCEMFLLPDGWYHNGYTNSLAFKERMKFLQDISDIFINGNHSVEFYLGLSGTRPEEFFDVTLKKGNLTDYLNETVGVDGAEDGLHISIVP